MIRRTCSRNSRHGVRLMTISSSYAHQHRRLDLLASLDQRLTRAAKQLLQEVLHSVACRVQRLASRSSVDTMDTWWGDFGFRVLTT